MNERKQSLRKEIVRLALPMELPIFPRTLSYAFILNLEMQEALLSETGLVQIVWKKQKKPEEY